MTGTVVSLDSRRRKQTPACSCARHQLEALTARALDQLAATGDQLLIDRDFVVRIVDDLIATVTSALEDSRRTNP